MQLWIFVCTSHAHDSLPATSFEFEQFEIFKSLKLKKFTLFDILNGFSLICIQFYKLSIILIEHPYFVQEASFKKFILQFKMLKSKIRWYIQCIRTYIFCTYIQYPMHTYIHIHVYVVHICTYIILIRIFIDFWNIGNCKTCKMALQIFSV